MSENTNNKLTGWKTKTGAALIAIAGVVGCLIPVLPAGIIVYAAWFEFGAKLFGAAGAAFLGIGIAHKVEKAGNAPKVLILLLIPLFLVSCATMKQYAAESNVPPPGCEDSLIYQYLPYPNVTDTVLQVAVYNFAEEVGGSKGDILKVIASLDKALEPVEGGSATLNASDFVLMVMQQVEQLNNRWGISLLIVSESIEALNVPSPLTICDAQLIRSHLAKQEKWVSMARANE